MGVCHVSFRIQQVSDTEQVLVLPRLQFKSIVEDERTIILQKRLQSLVMKDSHRFAPSSAFVAFLTAILA